MRKQLAALATKRSVEPIVNRIALIKDFYVMLSPWVYQSALTDTT